MATPLPLQLLSLSRNVRNRLRRALRPSRDPWLEGLGIRTVLDVGANTGQFAGFARDLFPQAEIHAFEPLLDCYSELQRAFARDRHFHGYNLAVGDTEGTVTMNRSAYSQSSSLLPMGRTHKEAFPHTQDTTALSVRCVRLDDWKDSRSLPRPLLFKIDVQGFEDRVLRGATGILAQTDVLIVEMSVEPLYEGAPSFHDVYSFLHDHGFEFRGTHGQLHSPDDHRVLQVDGVFVPRSVKSPHP